MTDCKCEHWQTCPTCYPQGFANGERIPPGRIAMLGAKRHDLSALVEAIKDAVYSKPGQPVNFTEALGALELVKLDLYEEMRRQHDL